MAKTEITITHKAFVDAAAKALSKLTAEMAKDAPNGALAALALTGVLVGSAIEKELFKNEEE